MIMFLLNSIVIFAIVVAVLVLLVRILILATEVRWLGVLHLAMAATFGLIGGFTLLGGVAALLHGQILAAAFGLVTGGMGCFMAWALLASPPSDS